MAYAYKVPEISSLDENEISDIKNLAYYTNLRLIYLSGIPVRVKITKKYIETNSYEEVDISSYIENFEKFQNFIYDEAYLYGYFKDGKLSIYDIYINENYLSTTDMLYFKTNTGIDLAETIKDTDINFEWYIKFLNSQIENDKDCESFHILPVMYLDDKREYSYEDSDVISNVIAGEKPTLPSATYPTVYSYTSSMQKDLTNDFSFDSFEELEMLEKPVEKTNVREIPEVQLLTTKKDREKIIEEVRKNVSAYYGKVEKFLSEEEKKWWKKNSKRITALYAVHVMPETRHIFFDYLDSIYSSSYDYKLLTSGNIQMFGVAFFDFIFDTYKSSPWIKGIEVDYTTLDSELTFSIVFEEELEELRNFYVKEGFKNVY